MLFIFYNKHVTLSLLSDLGFLFYLSLHHIVATVNYSKTYANRTSLELTGEFVQFRQVQMT